MKKSLFAVAALGAFAGTAQAQSSVSVYGLYDGGTNILNVQETTTAGAVTRGQSGGFSGNASASTRIGFRGTETLTKDLSAIFNYELAITPGSGVLNTAAGTTGATIANSASGPRTSIVGLASKSMGSVEFGRQLTGMHGIIAGDIWAGNNMVGDMTYSGFTSTTTTSPQSITVTNTVSGRVSNNVTRMDNMLSYKSPSVMGASLRIDYANNTLTNENMPGIQTALSAATLSYTWKQFSFKVGTATTSTNEARVLSQTLAADKTVINAANAMFKQGPIAVQYTFGANKTEDKFTGVQASKVIAQKLSAQYQLNPQVMAFVQYGQGGTQGTKSLSAVNNQTNDTAYQVGAEYALSKRTNLYAAYGNQERKTIQTTAKVEMSNYAAGLKHVF